MGLFQRRQHYWQNFLQAGVHWQIVVLLIVVCGLFAVFGDAGRETFRYDRLLIQEGEYWRLITGHFVHLGMTHLILNLAGLVLVWLLVGRYFSRSQWLLVIVIVAAVTTVCFWFIDEFLLWYVGLSGVLHGLLVAGTIRGYRVLPSESVIIGIIVAGKLAWEQFAGPLPGSESVSGGAVVVNAHLFGALGGVAAALAAGRSVGDKRSI
jgi:rhomboid family GlyGly-CTERM serine protease